MLLGFKTTHKGQQTDFVRKILAGFPPYLIGQPVNTVTPKIHTVRTDVGNRWRAGRQIQFATGVRTRHLTIFAGSPCTATQLIEFRAGITSGQLLLAIEDMNHNRFRVLMPDEQEVFARNDGFADWAALEAWFYPAVVAAGGRMSGKLIHWTEYRY